MLDDAEIPLLLALVVVSVVVTVPSVGTILEMAATSAAIGLAARGALALARAARRSRRRPLPSQRS